MITLPEKCLRDRNDCKPLSQICSDDGGSFFCCGENDGTARKIKHDKYTLCFKGPFRDEISLNDKQDIAHQMSVIAQALGIIESHYADEEDWSYWPTGTNDDSEDTQT